MAKKEGRMIRKLAYNNKYAQQNALRGILLENKVEKIIQQLVEREDLDGYIRHRKNSFDDLHGKDFTVIKNGKRYSFGVTISERSMRRANKIHPRWPTWHFREDTDDKAIEICILTLVNGHPRFPPE